jgi:hypothetical protein
MTNTATDTTIDADAAEQLVRSSSKVHASYKAKYAAREAAMVRRPKGVSSRALARCNGDWLAIELAKLCIDPEDTKAKLQLPAFHAVLAANGIDGARWSHLNPGQQRMCGGLALRAVVAENEELMMPEADAQGTLLQGSMKPPRSWIAKHQR